MKLQMWFLRVEIAMQESPPKPSWKSSQYRRSTLTKRRYNQTTTTRRLRRWRSLNRERANFLRRLDEYRSRLWPTAKDTLGWLEWREVLEAHEFKCAYCKTDERLETDHIIPLSKGGDNTKENVQPLCRRCNAKKGDKVESPPRNLQEDCSEELATVPPSS